MSTAAYCFVNHHLVCTTHLEAVEGTHSLADPAPRTDNQEQRRRPVAVGTSLAGAGQHTASVVAAAHIALQREAVVSVERSRRPAVAAAFAAVVAAVALTARRATCCSSGQQAGRRTAVHTAVVVRCTMGKLAFRLGLRVAAVGDMRQGAVRRPWACVVAAVVEARQVADSTRPGLQLAVGMGSRWQAFQPTPRGCQPLLRSCA